MNINVENLQKSFFLGNKNEVKALRNINFEIKSGETVAIVGPSGAGKSTLLHILGLMDSPSEGKFFLNEEDHSKTKPKYRAKLRRSQIGFLFQMHYLLPEFTAIENVLIPVWGKQRKKDSYIKDLLDRLGLSERLNHLPTELSGGEQQRVALARALINEPSLLLADEPTGNLDRETGEKVEQIIFSECNKRNITLILVTHNPELAKRAKRTIKMCDGVIV